MKLLKLFKKKSAEETSSVKDTHKTNQVTASREVQRLYVVSIYTFAQMVKRYWHRFIALAVSVAILFSVGAFFLDEPAASAILSLNFENSAKGRNPNGTRFAISDLRSYDVLDIAIKEAGIENVISASRLSECISISPTVQRNSSGNGDYYISASYRVTLNMPDDTRNYVSSNDMLDMVCRAFRESFYEQNIIRAQTLPTTLEDFSTLEYSEIGSYLEMISNRAQNYLQMRIDTVGSFTAKNGQTFRSLKQLISNLIEYDLKNYNAFVWENGVAKDKDEQIKVLESVLDNMTRSYNQYIQTSDMYSELANDYNNSLTASVLIPTYDSAGEYYMARTKTGVDELSRAAYTNLELASECQAEILSMNNKIEKLSSVTSSAQYAQTDELCDALGKRLVKIIEQIIELDDEYIESSTRNYISFILITASLKDLLHIKESLIVSILACGCLYIYFVRRDKRRLRKIAKSGDIKAPVKEGA